MKHFWFNIAIDWDSGSVINGKKFYNCKCGGCLVIYPDKTTVQFFSKTWFE